MSTPQLDEHGIPRCVRVEIEICSHCDVKCFGCDRFIDVGSPPPPMTLEQIDHFIAESLNLNWRWKRIHILGGEPTLHPEFSAVVARLVGYRKLHSQVLLRVITNGRGKLKDHESWLRSIGVDVSVVPKVPGQTLGYFDNMHIAPIDKDPDMGPAAPCGIYGPGEGGCGIGLTRHGYFLCGAGASVARIVGLDIGVMRLADLTHAAMLKQAEEICNICGHWTGPTTDTFAQTGKVTGPFWQEAITKYKQSPPELSVYGPCESS